MYYSNSLEFYNFFQAENSVLLTNKFYAYNPQFRVHFGILNTSKLELLQTLELLYQFFGIRPAISTVKSFGKPSRFNLSLDLQGRSVTKLFKIISTVRSSSRRKLISFTFKFNGSFFIKFKDFITLYPFKIRFYDFHTWRKQVTIHSVKVSKEYDKKYVISNFYSCFFRNVYYGQI
jgi:hypothetical protein